MLFMAVVKSEFGQDSQSILQTISTLAPVSWGAIGAATAVAQLCGLNETVPTLGAAEYHAPRTPIMRGVVQPGMTKDGVGWGAYTGVVADDLASRGFTGSGTAFDEASVTVTMALE